MTASARLRVRSGQSRVVAPDLRAGILRGVEEVQVVDGDDLRGALSGHQERMHGVDDVDFAANRSRSSGHSSRCQARLRKVTGTRASTTGTPGIDIRRQAILPGAREEHEMVVRATSWRANAAGQLVRVLADACARAQGGPIVEENTHARPC